MHYMLKSNFNNKQSKLMVSGKVPANLSKNVRQFRLEFHQAMADINPHTFLMQVDVQPVSAESQFEEVSDLQKLDSLEAVNL